MIKWIARRRYEYIQGWGWASSPAMALTAAIVIQGKLRQVPWLVLPLRYLFPLALLGIWLIGVIVLRLKMPHHEEEYRCEVNPAMKKIMEE